MEGRGSLLSSSKLVAIKNCDQTKKKKERERVSMYDDDKIVAKKKTRNRSRSVVYRMKRASGVERLSVILLRS